ncbi:MAG: hypothetical protein Q9202_003631 [Teloschistes flavicans]
MTGPVDPLLLRLPLELRQQIYTIIFGPRRCVQLVSGADLWSRSLIKGGFDTENAYTHGLNPGILGVSRSISDEALDVLYGRHVFVVNIHWEDCLKVRKFGVANLRRIRHLCIMAQSEAVFYEEPRVLNPQLWLPLLEGLVQFQIVAQEPVATRGYHGDDPILRKTLREWITWLDPVLQYFSLNLSETTAVSIDDDGRAETTAMMKKHFGTGYRRERNISGDVSLEQGEDDRSD